MRMTEIIYFFIYLREKFTKFVPNILIINSNLQSEEGLFIIMHKHILTAS